jgi:hypothetical protein
MPRDASSDVTRLPSMRTSYDVAGAAFTLRRGIFSSSSRASSRARVRASVNGFGSDFGAGSLASSAAMAWASIRLPNASSALATSMRVVGTRTSASASA